MTYAYSKNLIEKSRTLLAVLLQFGVVVKGKRIENLYDLFLSSSLPSLIEQGDYNAILGKSGIEWYYELTNEEHQKYDEWLMVKRTSSYWIGWILVYYQWNSCFTFDEINKKIDIKTIEEMYYPYHEMDETQFKDRMDELMHPFKSSLKEIRIKKEMTQKELSHDSNISLRLIQEYEQGRKDIKKASVEKVYALSKALNVSIEELIR